MVYDIISLGTFSHVRTFLLLQHDKLQFHFSFHVLVYAPLWLEPLWEEQSCNRCQFVKLIITRSNQQHIKVESLALHMLISIL